MLWDGRFIKVFLDRQLPCIEAKSVFFLGGVTNHVYSRKEEAEARALSLLNNKEFFIF